MSGIVVDLLSLETDMLKYKQRMKFLLESFRRYATENVRKMMEDELPFNHDVPIGSNGKSMQTRPSRKHFMERGHANPQFMFSSEPEKPLCLPTQRSTRLNQMRQIQKLSIVEECSVTVTAEDGDLKNELSVVSKPQSASKPHSFTLSIKFRASDRKTGGSKSDQTLVDKVSIPTHQCSLLTKNKNDGKENYEARAVGGGNDPDYTLKPNYHK
uniref:DNA replication and repair protein recF n=1 Tax=Lygus hesperus TaxID=30085 RepID=A0A0A9WCC4_LYGHE